MQQKRLLKDSRVPASARRFSLLALTLATLAATLGSTSLVQAEPVLNAPHSLEEYREKTLFLLSLLAHPKPSTHSAPMSRTRPLTSLRFMRRSISTTI